MTPELSDIRAKLVAKWEALPDLPPADQVEDLIRRSHGLCDLIHWIDLHPDAPIAEYRAYVARIQKSK